MPTIETMRDALASLRRCRNALDDAEESLVAAIRETREAHEAMPAKEYHIDQTVDAREDRQGRVVCLTSMPDAIRTLLTAVLAASPLVIGAVFRIDLDDSDEVLQCFVANVDVMLVGGSSWSTNGHMFSSSDRPTTIKPSDYVAVFRALDTLCDDRATLLASLPSGYKSDGMTWLLARQAAT